MAAVVLYFICRSLTVRYAVHSLLAPGTYTERLTRIRVIESFGGRPYASSYAHIAANMRVTSKQIRYDGCFKSKKES